MPAMAAAAAAETTPSTAGRAATSWPAGLGNDTHVVDSLAHIVIENPSEGIDTVNSGTNYVLPGNVENLALTGVSNINGTGNTLDNAITGNIGNNTIDGGVGNDNMVGG